MKTSHIPALTLALVLAACGGGDGSSTPTPTPTATATPTPTPTPTPPPITYTKFKDLADPLELKSFCSTVQYATSGGGAVVGDWFNDPVSFDYEPAAKKYVVSSDNYDLTFTEAEIMDEGEYFRNYRIPEVGYSTFLSTGVPRSDYYPSPTEYGRFAIIVTHPIGMGRFVTNCVTGVTTEPEDSLSGSALSYSQLGIDFQTFSATTTGGDSRSYFGYEKTELDFSVDTATGKIDFSISLTGSVSGTERFFGIFTGSGTIDSEQKSFAGTLSDADGTEIGNFGGWFFGPGGEEVGINWELDGKLPNGDDLFVRASALGSNP